MIDPPKNRLAEAMEAAGKSRSEVASQIGRTEDTVRKWSNGATIPADLAPTVAELLGVDPSWLMGWDRIPATTGEAV
jgi:transcriptional regulator with XRE-family HTH domain